MLREFREFVARGNVLDLAVAVIIGAAFATITTSLTEDVVMPLVGALFAGSILEKVRTARPGRTLCGLADRLCALRSGAVMLAGAFLTV